MTRQLALPGVALAVVMLATNPASAQLLTLGGDGLTIGGSGGSNSDISVDLDGEGSLLGLGNGSDNTATINLDLNGNGILDSEENAAINLFGPGQNGETQLRVGTNGNDDDVLVTLFGKGNQSGDVASANILPGGLGGEDGIRGGGDSDATLELFGPPDPTETGSIGGSGASSGSGAGGGDAVGPGGQSIAPATRVAAVANTNVRANSTAACFSPDSGQVVHLLERNSYSGSVTASWQGAAEVSIVPVNICPDARARLAAAIDASANVGTMQSAVASTARINAKLGTQYKADDVLAVDQSGDTLTVYVY